MSFLTASKFQFLGEKNLGVQFKPWLAVEGLSN